MKFELPNWPPRRLLDEAVLAHNLRHLDRSTRLDSGTSSWSDLQNCVLRFLRHQLCEYDAELARRAEYDPVFRDSLAREIASRAFRQYPWLGSDPRPLPPEAQSELVFDRLSEQSTTLHALRDQLVSAIKSLQRSRSDAEAPAKIRALKAELTDVRKTIRDHFAMLTFTTPSEEYGRVLFQSHQVVGSYSFGGRELAENYLLYAGFRCPLCQALVLRTKRPINFGQGRRMIAYSCHCQSYAIDPPASGYGHPAITARFWQVLESRGSESTG